MEIILVVTVVAFLWTKAVFAPPKPPSKEDQLSRALAEYLKAGIQIHPK
jgi:hypothetical protein